MFVICPLRVSASLQTLKLDDQIRQLADTLKDQQSMLVFGRGHNFATALETALKVQHRPSMLPIITRSPSMHCFPVPSALHA